jgi:hypothetical protein
MNYWTNLAHNVIAQLDGIHPLFVIGCTCQSHAHAFDCSILYSTLSIDEYSSSYEEAPVDATIDRLRVATGGNWFSYFFWTRQET